MKNLYKIEDELYIVSSSEKIKENTQSFKQGLNGDWFYNTIYNFIARTGDITPCDFKIILTTNKLLIKDGVQNINDEFLEWFVNNPCCEEVEIDDYKRGGREVLSYIIIIPKEELPIVNGNYGCTIQTKKQETIEEASERILANNIDGLRDALKDDDLFYFYKGIIQSYGEAMAKYQAEKMYSEINVKKSFENESLKWWMSLTMDEQVEIGLKYNEPTFNLTLRAIIHEFSQFKNK